MYCCSNCDGGRHFFHEKRHLELCSNCGIEWEPYYVSPEEVENMFKSAWTTIPESEFPSSVLNEKYNPDEDEDATPVLNYIPPMSIGEYHPSDCDDEDKLIDEERYSQSLSFDKEDLVNEDENFLVQKILPKQSFVQKFWGKLRKAIA